MKRIILWLFVGILILSMPLTALLARDKELDNLFERLYEDNVAGKISDERFAKMSRNYEQEQGDVTACIKRLKAELEVSGSKAMTTDSFIATVRKYTRTKKLMPRMLSELIDRVEVYNAEKIDGVNVQKLTIHYNCISTLEIPDREHLEKPSIIMQTRKGVAVSYAPPQNEHEKAGCSHNTQML
ncbi:MAG: DUF4368 domain-containing protein [Clostridia bacterium]